MKKSNVSKQPRKQRKSVNQAPLHARRPLMSVHLAKDLRKSLKKRNVLVHKGDKVRVMMGSFKGASGLVTDVDYSTLKVKVEGVVTRMQSGREKLVPMQPSNLVIIERASKKV
jgi:large subunit ribosomal protein L24